MGRKKQERKKRKMPDIADALERPCPEMEKRSPQIRKPAIARIN
jgi:hypothetical protein